MKKQKTLQTFTDYTFDAIAPQCPHFSLCNGCLFQNMSYEDELKMKEKFVLSLLKEAGIEGFHFKGTAPSPASAGYKNKMEFSFGDEEKGGKLALGMRKRKNYYEVVTCKNCEIIDDDYKKILSYTIDFFISGNETFYHKIRKEGGLRHLVVRKGLRTGEILINLVTTNQMTTDLSPLVNGLLKLELSGCVTGILHTINESAADVVRSDSQAVLYGRDYFFDQLLGLKFKITPYSFFQTNTAAAEKLYETALAMAGNCEQKTVLDLYSGTGTITCIAAQKAKRAVGIEIVDEAVGAAKENAELNNMNNCAFICGDVLKELDQFTEKPDLIIIDPPRSGIHPKAIGKIINFGVDSIIYISCKPASLARDLIEFCDNGYKAVELSVNDMFPRTGHVETVVLLSRKGG